MPSGYRVNSYSYYSIQIITKKKIFSSFIYTKYFCIWRNIHRLTASKLNENCRYSLHLFIWFLQKIEIHEQHFNSNYKHCIWIFAIRLFLSIPFCCCCYSCCCCHHFFYPIIKQFSYIEWYDTHVIARG